MLRKSIIGIVLLLASCSFQSKQQVDDGTQVDALVPNEPEGIVRYCWEEPIAAFHDQGPGLDPDGHWYHPSYTSIRETRQGRWRPCRQVVSEKDRRR